MVRRFQVSNELEKGQQGFFEHYSRVYKQNWKILNQIVEDEET